MQQAEILPFYPTVVYHGRMEGHEQYKQIVLSDKNIEKHGFSHYDPDPTLTERQKSSVTGEYRGKIFLHHDPIFEEMFKEITAHILVYLDGAMKVKTELFDFYIMKSWYSILEPHQDMSFHKHGSSDISFVYYPQVDETTYPIWFSSRDENWDGRHNELFPGMFDGNVDGKNFLKDYNYLTSPANAVKPDEGSLLLFPSRIGHAVFPDKVGLVAADTRISIAGDIKIVLNKNVINYESGLLHFNHWRKFV